jgi:hypothetical protein
VDETWTARLTRFGLSEKLGLYVIRSVRAVDLDEESASFDVTPTEPARDLFEVVAGFVGRES